ncbi:hypothetical protein B7494_g4651 [Chlorociboria aeruginascens]|nr:hypothetical protein B7494_g4651 [Chlorociboria aeruginascens]
MAPALPSGIQVLSGAESQRLRSFCASESYSAADLDSYAELLQAGLLSAIRNDFTRRAQVQGSGDETSSLEKARKELAAIAYGPTKVPLFNFLLQLTVLNPPSRCLYLEITRYLALEAKVPVDSVDLSGTSTFMYAISTKPYWDPEFADIMLEAGAEVNLRNRYGCTAANDIAMARDFSAAGKKKTVDALKYFVEKGGDLDIKDGDRISARTVAMAVLGIIPELGTVLNGNAGGSTGSSSTPAVSSSKIGRNDPCRCGSKRKFKTCCGKN